MNPEDVAPAPVPAARRCINLLFRPVQAFRDLKEAPLKSAAAWYGTLLLATLVLTAIVVLTHYDSMAAMYPRGYHPPVLGSLASVLLPLFLLFTAGMLAGGLFLHLLVYASGGRGGLARTLAVVLYAATPLLLTLWILEAVWIYNVNISPFIVPLIILWAVALTVAGIREFHGISTTRAALPFFLMVIVVFAVFLIGTFILFPDPCGGMCTHLSSATATCTGENITVTYQGGMDASTLVRITAYDTDPAGSRVMGGTDGVLPVGSTLVLAGPFFSPAHVVAVAHYQDGTDQVILDTMMKCGSGPVKTPTTATPAPEKKTLVTTGTVSGRPALQATGTPSSGTPAPPVQKVPATPANSKGLLVWYDFDDTFLTTGTVTDRSGSGRDARVTGTVRAGTGISGTNGITFTGRGYILAPDNPAANQKAATFSFWFRTPDPTRNYKFASAAEWRGGPGTGWTMATHIPEFWADDGPEGLLVPGEPNVDNAFVPGAWTHEAVVYDGTTMKEYTNGTLINTWHGRGVPMSRGVPMAVGGWPQFSGYNYVGDMDDFRIYDHALSAQEIAGIFTAGRG